MITLPRPTHEVVHEPTREVVRGHMASAAAKTCRCPSNSSSPAPPPRSSPPSWCSAWPGEQHAPPILGGLGERLTRIVDSAGLRWTVRGVGLTVALFMGMALLFGQDLLTNPIFGFVYVWVWVGLVPISLLFGPVWRTLNPFRTVHLLAGRLLGADPNHGVARLPKRVGRWPAAIGLFGFVWLELVAPDRVTIPILLFWLSLYTVIMLFGSVPFGQRWFSVADPFETYAVTMAKMSPWGRGSGGQILLRSPLAKLATFRPQPGMVIFLAVLIGSTGYDGFSNSSLWVRWIQNSLLPTVVVSALGLLGFIAIVFSSYTAACLLAGRLTHSSRRTLPGQFLHSLVPIALGYVTAHYLTLLIWKASAS